MLFCRVTTRKRRSALLGLTTMLGLAGGQMGASAASGWSIVPSPNPVAPLAHLAGISCTSASACTAVGKAVDPSGAIVSLAERWDGTTWTVEPTPMPAGGIASELVGISCTSATTCTAVGDVTNSAHTTLTLAEAWDGSNWTVQATPNPSTATFASIELQAVSCTIASACMAVGHSGGGATTTSLAERWDGNTWQIVPTPKPTGSSSIFYELAGVSCTSATSCEAVGSDSPPIGNTGLLAERWNGSSWTVQQTLTALALGELLGVSCTAATSCIAVGDNGSASVAVRWNGVLWSTTLTADPSSAQVSALDAVSCASSTGCVAVGAYISSGGATLPLVQTWNGKAWTRQSPPIPAAAVETHLLGVSCTSPSACTASGQYVDRDGLSFTLVEAWNGTAWTIVPSPTPDGALASLFRAASCTAASACIAVGTTVDIAGADVALAEQWDGTAWSIQSIPSPPNAADTELRGVACSAPTSCIAVGHTTSQGPAVAELWNGTAWTLQTVPMPASAQFSALTAVSCTVAGPCTAVGVDTDSAGTGHALALAWSGTSWSLESVASPTGARSSYLGGVSCSGTSACTAVGSYVDSTGVQRPLAERWDGTAWTVQATPTAAGVQSSELAAVSCSSAGACTAVGDDQSSRGLLAPLAERWDGTAWTLQAAPAAGTTGSRLNAVSCSTDASCTAVGDQDDASFDTLPLAEAWDGTTWTVQATPNPPASRLTRLLGVSCPSSTACVTAGFSVNSGGFNVTLVESETP
jgi:hypothetical protein